MRIISGILKGRFINFIKNAETRPLKDSVKENVFNILMHSNLIEVKIKDSNILDLYSGIGSFGIECISRGAKKVTFVEKDLAATKILKDNLVKFSILNKTKIFIDNVDRILSESLKEKFNIFFLDPPFASTNFFQDLNIIKERQIYDKKHIVIIHREDNSKVELKNILKIIEIKKYRRSKIIFGIFK